MNAATLPTMWENYSDAYLRDEYMRAGKTADMEASRLIVRDAITSMQPVTVLDVGCGPSAVDMVALNRIPGVTCHGLDSARMLSFARPNTGLPTELFIEGDLERGLPDGLEYDAVNLRHVLEHLAGFELPLLQAFRAARERVFVTFFLPPGPADSYHVLFGSRSFRNKYSRVRFEEFLRACGAWWDRTEIAANVVYDIRT